MCLDGGLSVIGQQVHHGGWSHEKNMGGVEHN